MFDAWMLSRQFHPTGLLRQSTPTSSTVLRVVLPVWRRSEFGSTGDRLFILKIIVKSGKSSTNASAAPFGGLGVTNVLPQSLLRTISIPIRLMNKFGGGQGKSMEHPKTFEPCYRTY